ncbi:MAG TPA: XRE family transcriptional regulator [Candidatus Limnocylindrales bacterium]|nr:XRE family transcriptional regulator [Candidatus Limnocylindrales bacterium]
MERMRLGQLRRARALSQQTLAEALQIAQGDVSKIERRSDVYVRTLRRFVEATGGRLRIVAEYPDAEPIEIEGFADIAPARRRVPKKKIAPKSAAFRNHLTRTKKRADKA